MLSTAAQSEASTTTRPAPARLGEELPVFCERCGYSLHGLPQARCEKCALLQFHCPECGHHQAINTLRPAVQTLLGRLRALLLVGSVIAKIIFFGLMALAWFATGEEITYQWNPSSYEQTGSGSYNYTGPNRVPRESLDGEELFVYGLFAFAFGGVARMLLLRWRRGWMVGVWLAGFSIFWITAAAIIKWQSSRDESFPYEFPIRAAFIRSLIYLAVLTLLSATVVWPIWSGLVTVFLPRRSSAALLAWQGAMSERVNEHLESALTREAIPAELAPKPRTDATILDRTLGQT